MSPRNLISDPPKIPQVRPHSAATVMHARKDRPRPSRPPLGTANSWGGGEERQLHGNVWVACSPEPRQSARARQAARRQRPVAAVRRSAVGTYGHGTVPPVTRWPHIQTTGCRPRQVREYQTIPVLPAKPQLSSQLESLVTCDHPLHSECGIQISHSAVRPQLPPSRVESTVSRVMSHHHQSSHQRRFLFVF